MGQLNRESDGRVVREDHRTVVAIDLVKNCVTRCFTSQPSESTYFLIRRVFLYLFFRLVTILVSLF